MIGAGDISDGHNISCKVLCSLTSHGFVLKCTTDMQNFGDVVVNVIPIVASGSLLIGAVAALWCGVGFRGTIGHGLSLLTAI